MVKEFEPETTRIQRRSVAHSIGRSLRSNGSFTAVNVRLVHYFQISEHPSWSLRSVKRISVLFTTFRSAKIRLFHCVQVSEHPSFSLRSGQRTSVFFIAFRSANIRLFHYIQVSEYPSCSLRSDQRLSVLFTTFRSANIRLFHCVQVSEHPSCSLRSGQRTSFLFTTFSSANIRLFHCVQVSEHPSCSLLSKYNRYFRLTEPSNIDDSTAFVVDECRSNARLTAAAALFWATGLKNFYFTQDCNWRKLWCYKQIVPVLCALKMTHGFTGHAQCHSIYAHTRRERPPLPRFSRICQLCNSIM